MHFRSVAAGWLLAALVVAGCAAVGTTPDAAVNALIDAGEQALRDNDAPRAERAFERAAALRHDASAEWGLVRSWMLAGEYRRALAFAAHAAGEHADVAEGAGLYAWLLYIGGQEAMARRTLDAAQQRHPDDAPLQATAARLLAPASLPDVRLLQGATRQAPYALTSLPRGAHAVASGVLLPLGSRALIPAEAVHDVSAIWVRDATGHTVPARVLRSAPQWGLVELALDEPLRSPSAMLLAPERDAFPGSPQMAVEFIAHADAPAEPTWPLLHTGFVGRWRADSVYGLGADFASAGPHGGPVFDTAGQLIGVALRGSEGRPGLLGVSALRSVWPEAFAPTHPRAGLEKLTPDAVYERAMALALQVIVLRREVALR